MSTNFFRFERLRARSFAVVAVAGSGDDTERVAIFLASIRLLLFQLEHHLEQIAQRQHQVFRLNTTNTCDVRRI